MKKKVVIRLSMNDDKSRSKALKTVVSVSKHVESAALTGAEKNQVEVVGEEIDAASLTRALRKKVAYADLVSVTDDKKPEVEKDNPEKEKEATVPEPASGGLHNVIDFYWKDHYYPIPIHVVTEHSYDPACCTMM